MANKNFIVKNGLEVGGQEVVSSSGVVTSAALGGQTLASTDSPTFNNLTLTNDIAVGGDLNLTGDLNITGDVNSLSVTDLDVTDQTITLGAGQVESASGGSGIIVDGSNASILWDETNDEWDFNKSINATGTLNVRKNGTGQNIAIFYSDLGTNDRNFGILSPATDSASAPFEFTTGNSFQFTIDAVPALNIASDRKIGIGTDLPDGKVHIFSSSAGTVSAANDANDLVLESSANVGISLLTGNSSIARIRFGDADANARGNIFYNHNTDSFGFQTAGSTKLTLTQDGELGVGYTNPNANLHIGSATATGDATNPALQIGGASTYRLGMYTTAEGGVIDNANGDDGLQFHTKNAGEAVRITANGNLQMVSQTTTFENPGFTYHTNNYLYCRGGSAGLILSDDSGINTVQIIDGSAGYINFETGNGSSRMRIDSAGNVGIGNTPQAIYPTFDSLQIGPNKSAILGRSENNLFGTTSNAYINSSGSWTYVNNGLAAMTEMINGEHHWFTASSGTAGNAITFQRRMSILSSGNVGIGTVNPQMGLHVGSGSQSTAALPGIGIANGSSAYSFFQASDGTKQYIAGVDHTITYTKSGTLSNHDHAIVTNNTNRIYIENTGNVGIGTTSPSSTFTVQGTIESSKDDFSSSNEGGQIMLRSPSNTTTSKRYSFDTFNVSSASVLRLISEDDSDGANGVVRMALDTKGTHYFTNSTSSFAHNTYAHAAVFSRNSTPAGTVVIEDSDVSSGIGNTVLNCYLRDQDPATFAVYVKFTDGGGTVGSITHNDDGGGVTYNTTSDYRLKENVNYDWDGLSLLNQLKPAKFNFIRQPSKTLQGFLAHEVKDIVPSSVQGEKDQMMDIGTITDSDGNTLMEGVYEHFCKTDEGQTWTRTGEEPLYQELDYSRIVPLLTKAIQEQQTIIENLQSRLDEAGL